MTNDDPSSVPRQIALWTEILGPPALWFAQFQLRYALVPWCCANGNRSLLWLSSAASVGLAMGLVILAWMSWRSTVSPELAEQATIGQRRARFMALTGLMSGALFLLLIVAQAIPVAFVDPCIQ